MDTLSIVIPAYNEEKRIGRTLEEYSNFFNELVRKKEVDYEILVVINNTRDRTLEIVKKFCSINKRIRYLNLEKAGKGNAVIEGFRDALRRDNELIGFVDADMATSPEAYYSLMKRINGFDGAIASRWVRNSVVKPNPLLRRKIARWMFNSLISILLFLPFKDTQCGAKIFKRKALEEVLPCLTMSAWAFDVDLLYSLRKKGFEIKERSTIWTDREYSTINFWKAGPWMALGVIRLRIINSPFKRIVKIYDKFVEFILK
jgi:glycosyltransferase involved in cell wall biosynthesis